MAAALQPWQQLRAVALVDLTALGADTPVAYVDGRRFQTHRSRLARALMLLCAAPDGGLTRLTSASRGAPGEGEGQAAPARRCHSSPPLRGYAVAET